MAFAIISKGGAGDLTYNILDPKLIFRGGTVAAILFTFGSFIGIEATAIYPEEVRDAERTVPKATFLAIFLIGMFYAFTTWTMVVGTGVDALVPAIAALPDPTLYLFGLAEQYAGSTVATLLGILFVTSVFASAQAMHNFIARYFYVTGREGLLHGAMGVTHAGHQSPHVGSVVQTVMAITSFAVIAYFRKNPCVEAAWRVFENRARFTVELMQMMRDEIKDCAIGIRFPIDKLDMPFGYGDQGGRAEDEGVKFVALLDDLVNYWDINIGTLNWGEDAGSSRFFESNHEAPSAGREVGTISMAVPSPTLQGRMLCLARIEPACMVGTTVSAAGAAGEVVGMLFHDPERKRTRS